MLLLASFWIGNLIILSLTRGGLNLRFKDPSLTFFQILWAIFWLMLLTYYLNEARSAALILALLIINFGAFRLNLFQLAALSSLAIISFALVIFFLHRNHPDLFSPQTELFVLAGFAAALFGTTLVGQEMVTLRRIVGERNQRLEEALEQVKRLAVTDELTGAYNRRNLLEILRKQKALADRGNLSFSICFFDLDHFKKINDQLGHAAGDEVLKRVVAVTQRIIRDGDYLVRYGGEEFVVVLIATVVDKAEVVAERIRATIEGESFRQIDPALRVTISLGCTEFRPNESLDAMIARADASMYEAKKRGRNTIVSA
jgi:diguanylate cyclase (GGDEF)-like protein